MYNVLQLEERLKQRFGPVKRSRGKNGIELITRCPKCGKNKLTVNAENGIYKCWRGCMSGTVKTLFHDIQISNAFVKDQRTRQVKNTRVDLPGELIPLKDLDKGHVAVQYLLHRGFDPYELDSLYSFKYCIRGKKYAGGLFDTTNTIIIPVIINNELIGWQSRLLYNPDDIEDDKTKEALGFIKDDDGDWIKPPKYFTMPGLDKGKILWNYDWARQSEIIVICEGVFDAIKVGRCAVAAFGKSLTNEQINLIKTYWKLAVILLDPGDAINEMRKLELALSGASVIPITVYLQGYKDAGEAPREEIWRQIDNTIRNNTAFQNANIGLESFQFII